jgi:predicted PurR-regulated permease PerM
MQNTNSKMSDRRIQRNTFFVLLISITVAFFWVMLPFAAALFWALVLAIIFSPINQRFLRRMPRRHNVAALLTMLLILFLVILPLTLITLSLVKEIGLVYQQVQSGELDFPAYFRQVVKAMPEWMSQLLARMDLLDLSTLTSRVGTGALQGSQQIATRVLGIGQNTLDFVVSFGLMLYVLFFLVRDGHALVGQVRRALPLEARYKSYLFEKFTTVIRATVKGNIAVAATQGALGGFMFAFLGIQGALLWGVVMAVLSLLPAVGAAIVWLPVSVYLLLTGSIIKGVSLIAFGVLVIGLVDNVLRPILVGKDTEIPDYVVLISTLGGIALFGLSGFVVGPVIAGLFISGWALYAQSPEAQDPR